MQDFNIWYRTSISTTQDFNIWFQMSISMTRDFNIWFQMSISTIQDFDIWFQMLKASSIYGLKWVAEAPKSQITNHNKKNSVVAKEFYGKFLRSFKYTYYIIRNNSIIVYIIFPLRDAEKLSEDIFSTLFFLLWFVICDNDQNYFKVKVTTLCAGMVTVSLPSLPTLAPLNATVLTSWGCEKSL